MIQVITDSKKIEQVLKRNVEKVIDYSHLKKSLESGRKLRIKLGIDPTGPKLHLGRAIALWKLREFQELGHQIILIIGDFTGQIGDASDKKAERKTLTLNQIKKNIKNYKEQVAKILDIDKVELRYNNEWLSKLRALDVVKLAQQFSIYQMIERRNFKERFIAKKPMRLHELMYPLFQAYDSVAVKADVEIGGSDQLFNLKAGRKIQEVYHQVPQDIMTLEMLLGTDGRKMSTSWGNIINIMDPPQEQYGKIMSIKDELIIDYFRLASRLPLEKIAEIKKLLDNKELSPRDAKALLAREIVSLYHNRQIALKAEEEFQKIFQKQQLPNNLPLLKLSQAQMNILDLLVRTKLCSSKSEAKRLILQKAVEIDGNLINDWRESVSFHKKPKIIKVGKRRFVKVVGKKVKNI